MLEPAPIGSDHCRASLVLESDQFAGAGILRAIHVLFPLRRPVRDSHGQIKWSLQATYSGRLPPDGRQCAHDAHSNRAAEDDHEDRVPVSLASMIYALVLVMSRVINLRK
jgi:hypothetical protein